MIEKIKKFCEKYKGKFYNSRWQSMEPTAINYLWAELRDELIVENSTKDKKDKKGLDMPFIRSEYDRLIQSIYPALALDELRNQLKHDATVGEKISQIIDAACEEHMQVDCVALKHWMWQVKRKIYNLPVKNHLMIMLYESEGGSGKSTLVARLLEPINLYVLKWDLPQIASEKNHMGLASNYVVFCDEMAQSGRCDVESLKQQITAEFNSPRKFHTQEILRMKQNCSFIGASQVPLDIHITDQGSMRRFWQMKCKNPMNWTYINQMNPLDAWKSIDENLEEGYFVGDIHKEIKLQQKELSTPCVVASFVEKFGLLSENGKEGNFLKMGATELYGYFSCFCKRSGIKAIMTDTKFGILAKKLLNYKRTARGRAYFLNTDHDLNSTDHQLENGFGNPDDMEGR